VAGDADADWIARSTGQGVVWAHDFRNVSEYTNFLRGQKDPFVAKLGVTPFGASRAIAGRGVGTTFAADASGVATRYQQQTWTLTNLASFPDPATVGQYDVYVGTPDGRYSPKVREAVRVTAIDYRTNQMTVLRGREGSGSDYWTLNYLAGVDTVGVGHRGQWRKPFGAFPAGQNGLAVPDRGIVTGLVPQRDWTGFGDVANNWAFRTAYYGHPSYHSGTLFDGSEFYLQWRMRISNSRFLYGTGSKLWYLQVVDGTVNQQFYGHARPMTAYDLNRWPNPAPWPYNSGGTHVWVASTQSGSIVGGGSYQYGGEHGSTCVSSGGVCWKYPVDQWTTWLLHVRPGRHNVAETLVELFACPDGDSAYTTVMSVANHTVVYDSTFGGVYGYNSFWPQNYANDYAGSGGTPPPAADTLVEYTQIILSKSHIAPPAVGA
jgi:hypothetical protein